MQTGINVDPSLQQCKHFFLFIFFFIREEVKVRAEVVSRETGKVFVVLDRGKESGVHYAFFFLFFFLDDKAQVKVNNVSVAFILTRSICRNQGDFVSFGGEGDVLAGCRFTASLI